MIRSLYTGLSGLINYQRAVDVTGNNLANQGVIGFKSSRTTFRSAFEYALNTKPSSSIGGGVSLNTIDRNMNPGIIEPTDVFTDVAIGGKGFFPMANLIRDGDGNVIDKQLFLSRVGNFDIAGNNEILQGEMRMNLLGLQSKVDAEGHIIPGKIPTATEMIEMTDQEKIDFYNSLEAIDLSNFSVMHPLASTDFNVYGNLNSSCGPSPSLFELTSAVDEDKKYKIRISFDKSQDDMGTMFKDDKQYSWKIDLVEWPSDQDKPVISDIEGTMNFSRTGSIVSIDGSEENLLGFTIDGEEYTLKKSELENAFDYEFPQYSISQNIISNKGELIETGVTFEMLNPGSWVYKPNLPYDITSKVEVICSDGNTYTFGNEEGNLKAGMISFGSDGQQTALKMVTPDNEILDITPEKYIVTFTDGSTQELNINFNSADSSSSAKNEKLSEWSSDTVLNAFQNGGRTIGTLNDINFDSSGNIVGNYSNGESAVLARIPLVQVLSPEALKVYDLNTNSFEFDPDRDIENLNGLFRAGEGGTGNMVPKALEYSNVNTAKEMTNLIMYQRLLQFNARSVQTADAILQEAVQLKR